MKKSLLLWLTFAVLAPLLNGCFPVAVVGMSAGALMVADRRISENYLADEAIEIRALKRIGDQPGVASHVNVTSYNRNVLLSGECFNEEDKAKIEQIAVGVPNVRAVYNQIQIAPVSSFGDRSSDSFITSKVKARFIDANQFAAHHVKVVTERGTVFLLGLVTEKEANAAVEVARTTSGVKQVVRLFEIISQEEADRFDAGKNNPPPEVN
ncbi:MAG: BON domain-containing protein [Zoogloeaceae bacterium]|jgi:osmotically-inducible protein OsmY|nr:BON domain-containing protein [Zoogloeaceae bacterium]